MALPNEVLSSHPAKSTSPARNGSRSLVGSRSASPDSLRFASDLASVLAARGVIIVSGGALGIDTAAHEGALAAGGVTWAVLPTAYPQLTPPGNEAFFRRLHQRGGTIIWTLKEDSRSPRPQFLARNGVLVSLSSAVVVVAAMEKSGARNAAGWARKLGRALYAVAGPPWIPELCGTTREVALGARLIHSIPELVRDLLGDPSERPVPVQYDYIFQHLSNELMHFDGLAERTGVAASKLRADLMDLLLRGQVQEIDGCYKVSSY